MRAKKVKKKIAFLRRTNDTYKNAPKANPKVSAYNIYVKLEMANKQTKDEDAGIDTKTPGWYTKALANIAKEWKKQTDVHATYVQKRADMMKTPAYLNAKRDYDALRNEAVRLVKAEENQRVAVPAAAVSGQAVGTLAHFVTTVVPMATAHLRDPAEKQALADRLVLSWVHNNVATGSSSSSSS